MNSEDFTHLDHIGASTSSPVQVCTMPQWHCFEGSVHLPGIHMMCLKAKIAEILEQGKAKKSHKLLQLRLPGRTVDLCLPVAGSLQCYVGNSISLVFTSPHRFSPNASSEDLQRYLSHYQLEGEPLRNLCAVDSKGEQTLPVWFLRYCSDWREIFVGYFVSFLLAFGASGLYLNVAKNQALFSDTFVAIGSIIWFGLSLSFFVAYPLLKRKQFTTRYAEKIKTVLKDFIK